jgi:acetylornithine deacetylase
VYPGASIETEIIGEVRGLEPIDDSEALRLVAGLTGAADAELVSFGTEAGLYQALGMSTVVCGPGSISEAHKPDEFVEIAQLQACLDMLTGLSRKLSEDKDA